MDEGRDFVAWNHTSAVIAAMVNSNPFRSGEPVSAESFHPHIAAANAAERAKPLKMDLSVLKTLIIDKHAKKK